MISKDDVKYIAALSRIHLQEGESESLTKDLEKILDYIDLLKKVDVSKVDPTSHVFSIKNVFREDSVKPSLTQKDALKFSVAQQNGSFKVPKVIE